MDWKGKLVTRPVGLGDTIKNVLHVLGVEQNPAGCACKRRQEFLNAVFPYAGWFGRVLRMLGRKW